MPFCKNCNYSTSDNSNFKKHLKSKKHFKNTNKKQENKELKCPKCEYTFKHRQSLWKHKNFDKCEKITNINNTTNNTTNIGTNIENQNIHNNINITFNINSSEEAEFIKSILTPEKIRILR